jgi:hypothetical protein
MLPASPSGPQSGTGTYKDDFAWPMTSVLRSGLEAARSSRWATFCKVYDLEVQN